MGAGSSSYSCDLANPTRTLHSQLDLNLRSSTPSFIFTQSMKKGVGEDQTLQTRIVYQGTIQPINTNVSDKHGNIIHGNPRYLLHTERMKFDVDWGSEFYQAKKGLLVRQDLIQKKSATKNKLTPIITTTTAETSLNMTTNTKTNHNNNNNNTNNHSPPSPSSVSYSQFQSQNSQFPILPPSSLAPRGYSQSAPLSPAPISGADWQRNHNDNEDDVKLQHVTGISSMGESGGKNSSSTMKQQKEFSSTTNSTNFFNKTNNNNNNSSTTTTTTRNNNVSLLPSSFTDPSAPPRLITITYNGAYHSQLQKSTSLEEMYELLQQDYSSWFGSFSLSGLMLEVELLSEEIKIKYYKPKFEYLWAQVQDECPIIMALSNIYHEQQQTELFMPRKTKT